MPLSQIWVLLVLVLSVLPEQGNTCCFLAVQRPKIHKVSLTQYSLSKRDAQISNNLCGVVVWKAVCTLCQLFLYKAKAVLSISYSWTWRRLCSTAASHSLPHCAVCIFSCSVPLPLLLMLGKHTQQYSCEAAARPLFSSPLSIPLPFPSSLALTQRSLIRFRSH